MKKIIVFFLTGFFSLLLIPKDVDLVALQKKEKKRRDKAAKSKYVLTNDRIVEFSLKKSKTFVKAEGVISKSVSDEKKKKPSPDEKDSEEYWRGRLKNLTGSIESIKKMLSDTQSQLNRESTNFLIAATASLQRQIQNNIIELKNRVEKLKADLKQREADLEAFHREARKAGVLPGWLR